MTDFKVGDTVTAQREEDTEPMTGKVVMLHGDGPVWWVQFPDYVRPIPMHRDHLTKVEPS